MKRNMWVALALAGVWCVAAAAPVQAQDDVTDQAVQQAMRDAVDYLYGELEAWGHWDAKDKAAADGHDLKQYAGRSSLIVYALLSAGEEWQGNPRLQNALRFLAEAETEGTYAVGLRAHVWPKLPDRSSEINFFQALEQDGYKLVNGQNKRGAYRYTLGDNDWDHSCTQYGALGAWECAKRGYPVPAGYWKRLEDHFLGQQSATDGGWSYRGGDKSNLQMTAAGLACLYITLDYLHAGDFQRPGVTERHPVYQSILRGLDFMNSNYRPSTGGYNMVGVERVALASGWKYFNGRDWYRSGAHAFLRSQRDGGAIPGGHGNVNTAFALVFLSRGRVPVFANKLAFDEQPWNNRPNDLANLNKWVSDQFEIAMNWQVVGIGQGTPEEWLEAPMLYLASHEPLSLTDDEKARLKRYIDLGGMLVVNADGRNRGFTQSLEELFAEMYPYEFQTVERDDPVFDIVYHLSNMNVRSLHNGVRHLVVELPGDAAADWQSRNTRDLDSWKLMANLFQYAIERTKPRARLDRHITEKTGAGGRPVHVGRARYAGNWNPEPLAWHRLDVHAANNEKATLITHEFDLAQLADANMSMVHVVGTDAASFTPDEIAAIKQYVNDGGVLVFEAAGGRTAFTSSVTRMLNQAWPEQRLRRVDGASPILTGDDTGGYDCTRIDYRMFYKQRLGAANRPSLQAMFIDNQPRIIISAEDITEGMLGQPVWGVFGYDSESASRLMTNIALWSAKINPADGVIDRPDIDAEENEDDI